MARNRKDVVVVGVDRSDEARAGVEFAATYALRRDLPLRLVHAYEPSIYGVHPTYGMTPEMTLSVHDQAQKVLDDAVDVLRLVHPSLPVTTRLEAGSPAATLIDESATAELLVVGCRGVGGFADLLVGSTTLHVASHAHCPVVAVPARSELEGERRGIVVGVDGSAVSELAIGWAFQIADEWHEPLIAVHTWTDPTTTGPGVMLPLVYDAALVDREEKIVLSESLAGWSEKFPDVSVEARVQRGHPVKALVKEAATAKLVVVGSHGRGAVRSLVLGSVSHGVLHHASTPVAVVRRES